MLTTISSIRIQNLPPYSLSEVAKQVQVLRCAGKDVIDCSQLNPTLPPPQLALDRLIEASLLPHNHRYSSSIGISALRTVLSKYYDLMFSARINPDQELVVTQGAKEGCYNFLLSILSPGDTVLIPVPAYPVHCAQVTMAGGSFVGVPLWKDFESYRDANGVLSSESDYFFSRLENRYKQTWPRPKVVLTSFPHNPTGSIVTKCFYDRLREFSQRNSVLLVNDFAHGDLFYDPKDTVSLMSGRGESKLCAEVYSISKGYSLAGWRIGCVVGDREIIDKIKAINSYTGFGVFQPIQIATSKFLEDSLKNMNSNISREFSSIYADRHSQLLEGLTSLGWGAITGRAGSMMWARIPEKFRDLDSEEVCRRILENCQIAFSPGTGFDAEQTQMLRISLSEPERRIRELLKRLEQWQNQ